jgi:hypothetical protein
MMESSRLEGPAVFFGLAADFRQAHRRVGHRKADWGLLACRSEAVSTVIWIYRVGTFGIGSFAFWWGRLVAAPGRIPLRLCSGFFFWMSFFADDLKVGSGGQVKWLCRIRIFVIWIMLGTPFAGQRFRGKMEVVWVGYYLDYVNFEMGLSEKRALWMTDWIAAGGMGALDPPWHLGLNYEYALRKEAFKRAMESPATVTIAKFWLKLHCGIPLVADAHQGV